jgi:hypothetical protein
MMLLDFVGRRVPRPDQHHTIPQRGIVGTQTYQVLSKPLVMAELCSFAKIGGFEPENWLRCDVERKNYGRAALAPSTRYLPCVVMTGGHVGSRISDGLTCGSAKLARS